jgi:predicted Ser/Thr protein kinase
MRRHEQKTTVDSTQLTNSGDENEEALAMLVAELMDAAQQGQAVSLEEACRAHPDFADPLRALWGAIMVADAAGDSGLSCVSLGDGGASDDFHPPREFGDYELGEEIGRGGMGIVFRARQLSLDRDVAVKMMIRGALATDADRMRFQAEAEAAAKLNHPNIVPVYHVGNLGERAYLTMKFIEGETLADLMAKGPLPPRVAAKLLAQVTAAVEFAHSQGVLHRDLKPSNILIDSDGQPHITDFGLAKRDTDASLTRTGAILGTPAYMSPEQASGGRLPIEAPSDVYSLGCILYQMLSGQPAVVASSPVDAVMQVLEQDPPPPRESNPKADRDLELIALRCMQKPPELRYAAAGDLASDLNSYLNDEPISARSGRFNQVVSRLFRETHHAAVLENWGLLWMWHAVVLFVVCLATNALLWTKVENRWSYAGLWIVAIWAWAAVFWALRRRIGPVTFVERQIAHVWAASMIAIALLFPLEWWLDLTPLTLSPVLGLVSMMVFIVKAGILSGQFYIHAAAMLAATVAMAVFPSVGHLLFGAVSAACFFVTGLKYHLRKQQTEKLAHE